MPDDVKTLPGLIFFIAIAGLPGSGVRGQDTQPPTRHMNGINWMDFQKWVPSEIDTVLLPVGTLEAHGVANNGADNTVPEAITRDLSSRVDALIAPTIPYGVTTYLSAFPGTFRVPEEIFQSYCKAVMTGLAGNGFKHMVVINGHGPNFELLREAAAQVSEETGIRTLVINWWAPASNATKEIFGNMGAHGGSNENAAILATNPEYVHPEYYSEALTWWETEGVATYPFPSSIVLPREGEGLPDFDPARARLYYSRVLDALQALIVETRERWNKTFQ